ncbi:MAG: T9SS type A sorting domain-containing protein [Flavobacterium sp. JAD_PAG50586_2]|nr:MAG: T9SS type A sorting domain-containing protein [Flavobacterium sp. JAD_PAG50586_2]
MKKLLLICLLPLFSFSQGYTSYFTGNATNITTTPEFGVCMMGGATEHDNAMTWLLQKANGGDVVVLRSSGSNGYNDYLYSELGVTVNSVETLVITSIAGATNPYVLDKVANAEMIWFAGGDQWNYVSYFKDNALEDLINNHVNVKHAPIGGTSAGMAILGGYYFSAQNGSVTSAQALNNPYNSNVTIGGFTGTPQRDFLNVPRLGNIITDTHYDNPDRRGRHVAFIARIMTDYSPSAYGIACNEYVAVCYGADGKAYVYGDYPNYDEFAYFIQPNCLWWNNVQALPGQPLTWDFGGEALKVYKVPGTMHGTNYFDMNDWGNWSDPHHSGGSWEHWSVNNGSFTAIAGTGLSTSCALDVGENELNKINTFPNPFINSIHLDNAENAQVEIFDSLGKRVFQAKDLTSGTIDTSKFTSGLYFIKIQKDGKFMTKKMIKD